MIGTFPFAYFNFLLYFVLLFFLFPFLFFFKVSNKNIKVSHSSHCFIEEWSKPSQPSPGSFVQRKEETKQHCFNSLKFGLRPPTFRSINGLGMRKVACRRRNSFRFQSIIFPSIYISYFISLFFSLYEKKKKINNMK